MKEKISVLKENDPQPTGVPRGSVPLKRTCRCHGTPTDSRGGSSLLAPSPLMTAQWLHHLPLTPASRQSLWRLTFPPGSLPATAAGLASWPPAASACWTLPGPTS